MTATATMSSTSAASSSEHTETLSEHLSQRAELEEQFDEHGNAIKVGSLEFVEGILGTGAYGTVRLARRILTPPPSRSATPDIGHSAAERKRTRKQARRNSLSRSASAPSDSLFFRTPVNDQKHIERSASSIVGELFSSRKNNGNTNERLVAVKIFNKSILKRMRTMERDKTTKRMHVKTAYESVEREIALMKKLSHPNLVALYDVIDSPESDNLYMIIEYMPLGEVLSYRDDGTFGRKPPPPGQKQIAGVVNGHFDEPHAALFFVDILHALGYLHQHHICHRDLKPENILLDARGVVKISDFGVSHFFEDEQDIGAMRRLSDAPQHHPTLLTRMDTDAALEMTGLANAGLLRKTEGTWCFWSPEMCSSSSYFSGYASDMWAAGVCLYIFVTGKLPFFSDIPTELFDLISEADVPYKGLGLSNSLIDLLQMTLEKDPTKRAGVGDCLKHPFLQVARTTRIRQLSEEFSRSRNLNTAVEEEDIRKAFRIVTTLVNPATLLKNASKHLQEGIELARERLSMGGSTFSSSSSLVGTGEERVAGNAKFSPATSRRNSLTSRRSSTSSLVGSDEEKSVGKSTGAMAPPTATKRWNQQTKKASFQRVGASSSSFESTGSESSASAGPSSQGRLFPIPQDRVMTERRSQNLDSEEHGLNINLTERTSNMSGESKDEEDEDTPRACVHTPKEAHHHTCVEKRASELSAEEAVTGEPYGSPKRLRSKSSKEQCTIQ